ncbi:uncharacterized protein LOC122050651 [Zingiber officinale]|uniref:uncharacterized protein LOC122050651 n=1 Tax=Zingiber officinale TaxID=94328 RepID=UPI001C4BE02E|nr:uncharacterized protein LOC122050651 [Zingiber officinale]
MASARDKVSYVYPNVNAAGAGMLLIETFTSPTMNLSERGYHMYDEMEEWLGMIVLLLLHVTCLVMYLLCCQKFFCLLELIQLSILVSPFPFSLILISLMLPFTFHLFGRPQWLTVKSRSQCYVDKIREEL